MLPSDGVLMARNALETPPIGALRHVTDELVPLPICINNDEVLDMKDADMIGKKQGLDETCRRQKRTVTSEVKEISSQDARIDVSRKCKTDVFVSSTVYNRLSEHGGLKRAKLQGNPERKKADACEDGDEVSIGENIAGNNAGHLLMEDILPIHYGGIPDGNSMCGTPLPSTCPSCGEGSPSTSSGVCKQCLHRSKYPDPKAGTLDELLAYAQSFAISVKKMLTIKGDHQAGSSTFDRFDTSEISQASEVSVKPHGYQSEQTKQKGISYVMVSEERQPRKMCELATPAPSVCGDDIESMSMIDGDIGKDPRVKMERQASNVTNSESRPPLSRAKTKLKALYSNSRTKTFRSTIGRGRTGYDIKNDSSVLITSSKRNVFSDSRKSGRTQTFDSSNLHGRKDVSCKSRLDVIQEGTSVDPPASDNHKSPDKTHKYSISRSATSPGTNVINKLQREKSSFGTAMPLLRTNTKLTLRANKAAVLRKETVQKASTLFHEQPSVDLSEGSPVIERKRVPIRQQGESKVKPKQRPVSVERRNYVDTDMLPREPQAIGMGETVAAAEGSNSKQEEMFIPEVPREPLVEETGSEIYCVDKSYIHASKVQDTADTNEPIAFLERGSYGGSFIETNPYCDGLQSYGKGLTNQLVQHGSTVAHTPYFDKSGKVVAMSPEAMPASVGEEMGLYTDAFTKERNVQSKPKERSSGHWYSIEGVMSKSSTQLREATSVRSSLSDVVTSRNNLMVGVSNAHTKKQVKYSETDVDSGTIYHMAKRIASDQKVSSRGEFSTAANFFEIGGDVSRSSSSTSDHSSVALDDMYTGGFFNEAFEENDKKPVSKCSSSASVHAYFGNEGGPKPEAIECDIYTGTVFSPSANNLALSGVGDNWKNMSTNNSNRLPYYRCRSRTTMAHINNRRILNCSNNSSNPAERERSVSSDRCGPMVTQSTNPSYIDYAGYRKPIVQPVNVNFAGAIDFTKYDNVGMDNTGFFLSTVKNNEKKDRESFYQSGTYRFGYAFNNCPIGSGIGRTGDDLYTPGAWNTNVNNSNESEVALNSNNNYFGDFYTDGESSPWSAPSQEQRRSSQATAATNDFSRQSSPKYAPGSFYENAYAEPQQQSPPRAQAQSSFLGMFTGYGEPPASQQRQASPDYAGAFPYASMVENQSRTSIASKYEGYGRTSSQSPKRQSYDQEGYFGYSSSSSEDRRDHLDLAGLSPAPAVPKIRRVGAIICRENVANKDDYAEDVNRDLMEDPWIPISYRLAAEQVKEMGGGRCSSKDLFKASEARCDVSMMDQSPFVQGQMLESLGRRSSGWNLKNNTDSLKDDISVKWRDAREKGSHQKQEKNKASSSEGTSTKPSYSSVWRPTDHIPAKARGNRTITKSEPRGPTLLDKNNANANNSKVWSAITWVPSTVGSYVKKLW